MEDFLEEVISGCFKEYSMVNNERKGICSGWQHEDWHRGKGTAALGLPELILPGRESPAMRLERLAGGRAW